MILEQPPPVRRRRTFSVEYKRRIVEEADGCVRPGELAAMLRREGLYRSHLVEWRRARQRGELDASAPRRRGPKAAPPAARSDELEECEQKLARALERAERAEALVEIQKKALEILRAPPQGCARQALLRLVAEHAPHLSVAPLCEALGVARASYYRRRRGRAGGDCACH